MKGEADELRRGQKEAPEAQGNETEFSARDCRRGGGQSHLVRNPIGESGGRTTAAAATVKRVAEQEMCQRRKWLLRPSGRGQSSR